MTLPLSIIRALQHATQRLVAAQERAIAKGSANADPTVARLDAEALLSFVMNCTRSHLHTWPERVLNDAQAQLFNILITRRAAGEPVAYLTGHREFWSMTLEVTPDTLIPRPETELLVELALQRIPADSAWRILDLGTGSGAIALAIARERPHCHVIATDRSPAALSVARRNAATLSITNIEFRAGDWFAPLQGDEFHVIVSNPPYVSTLDPRLVQTSIRFEPLSALASGVDGLSDIRTMAATARQHLINKGWLLLEHGHDQGHAVAQILHDYGYQEVGHHQDIAGLDRVSHGRWGYKNR